MSLQQNTDRIRTTHVGSLPRPHDLLDALTARHRGASGDESSFQALLARSVKDVVRRQLECGIDIVTDGEFSKTGFFTYIQERLEGFEVRTGERRRAFQLEMEAFPEYYAEYFGHAMLGAAAVPVTRVVCTGPIRYCGERQLATDIANLKAAAAAAGLPAEQVFVPATVPSAVGANEYYRTEEEYLQALATELGKEYRAIVDAGLLLQVDDPGLSELFADPDLDAAAKRRRAQLHVEATNLALKSLPAERVRFHTCYSINEGPRIHDADLAQVIESVFAVHAGFYSFEAANPRHEHEYHLFERVKVPEGKVISPGVIAHANNIVEHPELVAERIVRYAKLVGRENVVPGVDCGFSSLANYHTEVHPSVVWAKFRALAQGAELATRQLW